MSGQGEPDLRDGLGSDGGEGQRSSALHKAF